MQKNAHFQLYNDIGSIGLNIEKWTLKVYFDDFGNNLISEVGQSFMKTTQGNSEYPWVLRSPVGFLSEINVAVRAFFSGGRVVSC